MEMNKGTHTVDKSSFGPGPWQDEPDRVEWRYKGYPCLIVRNSLTGALCGYVGVSPTHPAYKQDYNDVPAEAHGGLTYSDFCDEGGAICHIPKPGESDQIWWLGFDCSHCEDISPGLGKLFDQYGHPPWEVTYKDLTYVKREVRDLAAQLKAMEHE